MLENGTKSVELYYTLPKESVGTEIALEFEDQIIKKTIDDFHDPSLEGFEKDKIKRIESYTKDFKKVDKYCLNSLALFNREIPVGLIFFCCGIM